MTNSEAITALLRVIGDTIRDAGSTGIPSGHLYAALNSKGLSLDTYQSIIGAFKRADKVTERNNVLYWKA